MTNGTYDRYRSAIEGEQMPLAYVDRAALDANIRTTQRRAGELPIRVASKSIRCRNILAYVLEHDGFEGIMCYTGTEAAYLAEHGFDNLLVAYPVVDRTELSTVCAAVADGTTITLMVDSPAHVECIADCVPEDSPTVPLCLDIDMSTSHFGIHFGVRRSPITTPDQARTLATTIANTAGVELRGVMGYEGQIAGIPDDDPSNTAMMDWVIRRLKSRSIDRLHARRQAVIKALAEAGHELAFVNGGGTGSLESTTDDESVTEVTVGSGIFAPALFDGYRAFDYEPAAGFAIEVVRTPTDGMVTCRGGGYIASGTPGVDKTPTPHLPAETSLRDAEGAGEVQTPVKYDRAHELSLGDPVVFRHAKAGELCAQFETLRVIEGDTIVDRHSTYRGDGRCFL
ncbi:amino acid deaminase/aldolase [Halocatena halophila]|uniref:amino acid deaminase/aldolase n=1 Tax=Halocatena halophila TaxID=2814576 RepID=UPI002ED33275